MRQRFLIAVGLLSLHLAVPASAAVPTPADKRPNVIFLLTDDQRGDTVGALGNPHVQTPNLDTLVKDGFVFRNGYCQGGYSPAVCLPSRQMILRGCSYFSRRFQDWQQHNLPRSMNRAGYSSCFLGKRGNNDTAVLAVFQSAEYLNRSADAGRQVRRSDSPAVPAEVPGRDMADGAIRFLREYKKRKDAGRAQPFFMHLAPPHPHDPRIAPREFLDRYDAARMPLPASFLPFHPFDNGELFIRDELLAPWPRTEDEIRRQWRDYCAAITCLDAELGRIFQALKEIGEYDNTLFVFTSDQGISLGGHGLMGKQNLYEESMKVPIVFCGPGVPKGGTSGAFVYLFDVYPTVCELIGAASPAAIDGRSLVPVVQGKAAGVRDTIFLAYRDVQRAVRRGPWKLIRYPQVDKTQLFHLQTDPHETKDLAGDPAHAAKVKDLTALLAEEQRRFGDTQPLQVKDPKPAQVSLELFAKHREKPKAKAAKAKRKPTHVGWHALTTRSVGWACSECRAECMPTHGCAA